LGSLQDDEEVVRRESCWDGEGNPGMVYRCWNGMKTHLQLPAQGMETIQNVLTGAQVGF
jgi:hypothetical protein